MRMNGERSIPTPSPIMGYEELDRQPRDKNLPSHIIVLINNHNIGVP